MTVLLGLVKGSNGGHGRAGQGRAGQGRAGQGRAGQGRVGHLIGRGGGDVSAWEACKQAGLKLWAGQPCCYLLTTSLHHSTVHACHSRPALPYTKLGTSQQVQTQQWQTEQLQPTDQQEGVMRDTAEEMQ